MVQVPLPTPCTGSLTKDVIFGFFLMAWKYSRREDRYSRWANHANG